MATRRTASAKNKKSMIDNNSMSGFTIIEVVLVLAIAGLIFLMVFIALPQLQRAQRDTQRRQAIGQLSGGITQFQTNNNGKIPDDKYFGAGGGAGANGINFIKGYIVGTNGLAEEDFVDPSTGETYKIVYNGTGAAPTKKMPPETLDGTIYYHIDARCGDDGTVVKGGGKRTYAAVYKLEGSGAYCVDNG